MIFITLCKAVSLRRFAKPKTILVMRLTAILLLAGCLHVTASGLAQKVSINRENVPLKRVFADIKKQTGYVFFYNARLLEDATTVSVSVRDTDMKEVLDKCFKDQPLTYRIVNKTIVISTLPREEKSKAVLAVDTTPAQIVATGRVIDDSTGKVVAGASISVKGTKRGATSNSQGVFSLLVRQGAVLSISSIGYESQDILVKQEVALEVRLKFDTKKDPLANVVVTGYQIINKESFTGNAITVSGEELRKVNPVNVLKSIQSFDPSFRIAENNLAGSNPNRLPTINLRGSTALPTGSGDVLSRANLTGNNNLPTFILDGYEVSIQKVYDLDMTRIQSITLLKDAAATAVYGSRAANGVLVITTRAPKAGKLQLYYNTDLSISAPDLTGYHLLNAEQKLEYEKLAGLYESVGANTADIQEALYYQKKKNVVSGVNTYWLSQPVRTPVGQKHSVYLEGGSSTVRYGLDLRYQTQPGVMKGSTRDRYSLGVDLSYNPSGKFLFKNTLTVTQVNAKESPWGNFGDYVRMNPYYPKTDSNGHILQAVDKWLIDTHANGDDQYKTVTVLNPMYNATLASFNKSTYLEFIDAFSAEWNIAYGLRLRGQISVTKRKNTTDDFASPLSNEFYFYAADKLTERGRYNYTSTDETILDGNTTLSFNRQLGNHFFNATLGANIKTYLGSYVGFTAIGFTNDRFTNIGFAQGYAEGASPGGYITKERLLGAFLSGNYSYLNKYLLDVSIRADGSSKFGADKRIAPFWSLGLGWNVHKEPYFDNSFISTLKLRASTGITGSVNFDPYMANTSYGYYQDWYSTGVGAVVTGYGNPFLQWQKTQNYDAGIDIGLFNDRLFIVPRYYNKLTSGLLADITLPPSTGFSFYKDNLGDMRNTGVELNLKYNVVKTKDLLVNVFVNMAHNSNKIVKISKSLKAYNDKADQVQQEDGNQATPYLRYVEGESFNTIYAVRSLGIDPENGKEIFIKKDGTHTYDWDVKDVVPVADNTPTADGFFGTNISYKGFMLQVQFYTRFGGKEYNQTLVDRVENADPRYNVDTRVLDQRWKQPGDKALYKDIADLGSSRVSDRFIQDDNVLDLNSVYMSYDFNKNFCQKLAMKSLRASVIMNDGYRWSSMQVERGLDYPFARMFTFSIQTSF
jgi:TonB-linked SusC/RagA family outer membrane protein